MTLTRASAQTAQSRTQLTNHCMLPGGGREGVLPRGYYVGNSQLRLENYCICKFIWNIVNVPGTRHQIKYVCMYMYVLPCMVYIGMYGPKVYGFYHFRLK